LPKLNSDDRPIRPWLFRVARNLLIDADRAARARPVIQPLPDDDGGTDCGLDQVLDRALVTAALQHLSPAHQAVLVETFYNGGSLVGIARELGIPHGTARSRLHYALQALRQQLHENDAIAC
jgi:RNA polymerase sigma-70 factor (ECF subfamily)